MLVEKKPQKIPNPAKKPEIVFIEKNGKKTHEGIDSALDGDIVTRAGEPVGEGGKPFPHGDKPPGDQPLRSFMGLSSR